MSKVNSRRGTKEPATMKRSEATGQLAAREKSCMSKSPISIPNPGIKLAWVRVYVCVSGMLAGA